MGLICLFDNAGVGMSGCLDSFPVCVVLFFLPLYIPWLLDSGCGWFHMSDGFDYQLIYLFNTFFMNYMLHANVLSFSCLYCTFPGTLYAVNDIHLIFPPSNGFPKHIQRIQI